MFSFFANITVITKKITFFFLSLFVFQTSWVNRGIAFEQNSTPLANGTSQISTTPATPISHTGSLIDAVQNGSNSFGNYFSSLSILFLVLAIMWMLVWALKKKGGFFQCNEPSISIESRLNMGAKKWLLVVKAHEKRLLVGMTEQNITLIAELDDVSESIKNGLNCSFETVLKKNAEKDSAEEDL